MKTKRTKSIGAGIACFRIGCIWEREITDGTAPPHYPERHYPECHYPESHYPEWVITPKAITPKGPLPRIVQEITKKVVTD